MAIPVGSSPDKVERSIAPPRTWEVTMIMTDTLGKRETYLTKEQVINSALYANRVHGLSVVTTDAKVVESRKAQKEKEK